MDGVRGAALFHGKELRALIRGYEAEIVREVEGWERNKILAASEPDLIAYLVEKYTLDPPRLLRDQTHIESDGEAKIDVSGRWDYSFRDRGGPHYVSRSYVTVAIPFEGDADLFEFAPSTFSSPPHGYVAGSSILISFQGVQLDSQQIRQEINSAANHIEEYLKWTKNDCDVWNARVRSVAEQCVRNRKRRLLEQAHMVAALGLPMKRRPDAAVTVSVPVARKKRPIVLPPTPKEAFKPEPALPDPEYDFILTVIDRLSQTIERSPSTFFQMGEEQIRDLILVNLNGHYEGDATSETFNAHGKTDILIRADGRNVFVAECKFWEGPKALHAAIDQILGYLTWRDTKAALLVFSKNVDSPMFSLVSDLPSPSIQTSSKSYTKSLTRMFGTCFDRNPIQTEISILLCLPLIYQRAPRRSLSTLPARSDHAARGVISRRRRSPISRRARLRS